MNYISFSIQYSYSVVKIQYSDSVMGLRRNSYTKLLTHEVKLILPVDEEADGSSPQKEDY